MQDNPKKRLWKGLVDEKKYTKSFEEFEVQFSTPDKVSKLYKSMQDEGLYTKDEDSFNSQFFSDMGKQEEVSGDGLTDTSITSTEPTLNTGLQSEDTSVLGGDLLDQSLVSSDLVEPLSEGASVVTEGVSLDPPRVPIEGTWREGHEGVFNYDLEGYENFSPTQSYVDNLGGWDRVKDYFEKEHPNVIVHPPGDREFIESGFGDSINYNSAKPNDLEAIRNQQELSTIDIESLSDEDRILYDLYTSYNQIKMVNAAQGNSVSEREARDMGVQSQAKLDKERGIETGAIWGRSGGRGDFRQSFVAGGADLMSSVLGIPEFLANGVVASYNGILSSFEKQTGLSLEDYKSRNYADQFGSSPLSGIREYLGDVVRDRSVYLENRYDNTSLYDNLKDGNYSEFSNLLAANMGEMLPFTLMMMASGGGGGGFMLGTAAAGAGKYDDIKDANIGDDIKFLNALVSGIGETGTELIGNKFILEPLEALVRSGGVEIAKSTMASSLRKAVGKAYPITSAVIEASTEVASTVIDNVNDIVTGVDKNRNVMDGVEDTIISSLALSGAIQTPTTIANASFDRSNRSKIEALAKKTLDIEVALSSGTLDDSQQSALIDSYLSNVSSINEIIESDIERKGRIEGPQKKVIDELNQRSDRLNSMLTQGVVEESVMDSIEQEIESVNAQIEKVVVEAESAEESVKSESDATEVASTEVVENKLVENDNNKEGAEPVVEDASVEAKEVVQEVVKEAQEKEDSVVEDVDASTEVVPEFSNELEAIRHSAENTTDANTILDMYDSAPQFEPDSKESRINEGLRGRSGFSMEDHSRYGDVNSMDDAFRRRWVDNNTSIGIEQFAESIGVEVQDVVDFMSNYVGTGEFESQMSDAQSILNTRYHELTGRNITPKVMDRYRKRRDSEETTADQVARDAGMTEIGMTGAEVDSRAEMESLEGTSPARAPLPSTLLKGVSDRLKQSGLAKSIRQKTSMDITEDLGVDGESVNGYVDDKGNIVINSDKAGLDTPIHELGHVWERTVERDNPELHKQGMDLIKGEDGVPYVDEVKRMQPHLEGDALYKEALAQAIGDNGAKLIDSQRRPVIKEWLEAAWNYISTRIGLSGMSPEAVANLTLREFSEGAAIDLLSGKKFARTDDGGMVADIGVKSESKMDEADKFMSDFMLKMKQRNGVVFQGYVDGSLSQEDMQGLVQFFRYAISKGVVKGLGDARQSAEAMGINSPFQVEMAYRVASGEGTRASGFKMSEAGDAKDYADYAKMSDDEYREEGRRLVEGGLIDPESLTLSIIKNPRALQPEEVAALQYYRSRIESDIFEVAQLVEKGTDEDAENFVYRIASGEGNVLSGWAAVEAKMSVLNQKLFDLQVAMIATGSPQSAALRIRGMISDKDFNIVQYLAEMKTKGYVSAELEAKIKDLSNKLNTVRAKLKKAMERVDGEIEAAAVSNITKEASRPTRRYKPKKETLSAVSEVLDSMSVEDFSLTSMSFQTNGQILFQRGGSVDVADAVRSSVAQMKEDVSSGSMGIADALEVAIERINSAVGKGKWDESKFRSSFANQIVSKGIPVSIKKPYVNSKGVLIIPGQYITDRVKNGDNTIDKLVESASKEMNGSFSEYDIRNAISGYGRYNPDTRSDIQESVSRIKRIARLISKIEDLKTKGLSLKNAKQVRDNDVEIKQLQDTVKALEKTAVMSPEVFEQAQELDNERKEKYYRRYIERLEDRLKRRDFDTVTKTNKYKESDEVRSLRSEAERIKNEFNKEKYRHQLENMSESEKRKKLAYDIIFNVTRGLSAGADMSAIGVQGAIYTAARPLSAIRTIRETMKPTLSEAEYEKYFSDLMSDPFYQIAKKAGLNLQLPNFYQSVQEEQFGGDITKVVFDGFIDGLINSMFWKSGAEKEAMKEKAKDKMNPFTLGNRNYSLVLSQIRMELFTEFLRNQIADRGLDVEMDEKEVKKVASAVNMITMSSKVPGVQGKLANDILSAIMFSAPKFVATWNVLWRWAPMIADGNYTLLKDVYGGVLGRGLGTMALATTLPSLIGWMMDDDEGDDEKFYNENVFNPRHSDFMKIKYGDVRVSLFQGIDGNIILLSRILGNGYETSSSKKVKGVWDGEGPSPGLLAGRYMANKLAPTPSIIYGALGAPRDREETYTRFTESFYPMWISGIMDLHEGTSSYPLTASLGLAGIFGLSANVYGGAEFAKEKWGDSKKAQDIFDKSGLVAYNPAPGQRTMWDGEKVSRVTESKIGSVLGKGNVYEDYVKKYSEFMTEAVISNEKDLGKNVNWVTKEALVANFQKQAYKYAEIKLSGIYARDNFDVINYRGVSYKLTEDQYPIKEGYIKEFMDNRSARYRRSIVQREGKRLRREGSNPTEYYLNMLADISLYNMASSYANTKIARDVRSKKVELIQKADYDPNVKN